MKRFFSSVFFLFVSLIPLAIGETDTTQVKVEVDRAFATIGDRVNFRVTVMHDPGVTVLGIDAGEVLNDFEVKEAVDFSTKEGGKIIEGKNYVITNYQLGEYVIRPFSIQYRLNKEEIKQLKTNSLYVTIESVDKDKDSEGDIRGVKGVRKIKGPIWVWIALFFLIFSGVIFWIIYVYQKRKALAQAQLEPELSPHDEAYQGLSRLQLSDLIRRGQVKAYFFQMSEILRRYFERRYGIKALESTTHELYGDLKGRLNIEELKLIDQVLSFCDLVKFAKYEPAPVEILRQNSDAKSIIDRTKEIVVQEEVSELIRH